MMSAGLIVWLFATVSLANASHFRGGSISWYPVNNVPTGSSVSITIRERFGWRKLAYICTNATIVAQTPMIGDASSLVCTSGSCAGYANMNTQTFCTDFSAALDFVTGEYYQTHTVPLNVAFSISYSSCCMFANLVIGASGSWSVLARINTFVRPDGYINTSPIAVTLPIIYKQVGVQYVHTIQMIDADPTDILKCRWATSTSFNGSVIDECGSMCSGVPGANPIPTNCTLVFTLTAPNMYAGVALQIEDFYNNAATTPMSSVPTQFLFYGYVPPSGCTTPPAIVGNRPNGICVSAPIGINTIETLTMEVYCAGKSIVDLVSSSPLGLMKSAILNSSVGVYQVVLSWTPVAAQIGPQSFCAAAVDNTNVQSEQYCITFIDNTATPDFVQGSASPIGAIIANETTFSIQTVRPASRPSRIGSNIYFNDATTNTLVQAFDCASASEVTYSGSSITVVFPVAPWIGGHTYYVTFDAGVASGSATCRGQSAAISSSTFWTFTTLNVSMPLTTTTTTVTTSTTTVSTTMTTTTTTTLGTTIRTTTRSAATALSTRCGYGLWQMVLACLFFKISTRG